jgi:preprotein translocase subunit YajC
MGIFAAVEAATTPTKHGSSETELLLFLVLIVAGFYFLLIRPQKRRQQQAQQQQSTVAPGARVVTTAGMYGTVSAVDGDDIILEVAPGVDVRLMRRAIMRVVAPGEAQDAEETVYDDEPGHAGDDTSDEHDTEVTDTAGSADDGLADSHHGDLASSDKDNVF